MRDSIDVNQLTIEYIIDEPQQGPRARCAACRKELENFEERIILRAVQRDGKTLKQVFYLCFGCSLKLSRAIKKLLGYEG